jgi:hypothetical protein
MDAIANCYGSDSPMINGTIMRIHHSANTLKNVPRTAVLDEDGWVLLQKPMP